jgi:hypothetical protein
LRVDLAFASEPAQPAETINGQAAVKEFGPQANAGPYARGVCFFGQRESLNRGVLRKEEIPAIFPFCLPAGHCQNKPYDLYNLQMNASGAREDTALS